jgi:hypothetical protein
MGVLNPTLEIRRLVGKFAFFFVGVYVLVLFGAVVSMGTGEPLPLVAWPLLLLPAAAFVPAVLDGLRLHRTAGPAVMKALWRRCLLFTVIAIVLLVAATVMVKRMTP